MSRDENRFRMVPVAVGVDFGNTNSVVATADLPGHVQVRWFNTQVGAVDAYRSALLSFREGRPPNRTLGQVSDLTLEPPQGASYACQNGCLGF